MAVGHHFGVGAPPILESILVGIGMFTGGTIWILTHGHIVSLFFFGLPAFSRGPGQHDVA